MTYKKLLLPVFAVTMLATSQQSDAMNFDNKNLIMGIFIGAVGCLTVQYVWKNIQPRIPRPSGKTIKVVKSKTIISHNVAGSTSKKPTFDEVNELVKQLGQNWFLGVNIGHNCPEGRETLKDKFKTSPLVLDLTNGLVVKKNNEITWCKDLKSEIEQEGDTLKILRKDDKDAYIAFDTQNNEAKAIGMDRFHGFDSNSMQKLRTYQTGNNL
jgi:hypothetical protein